MRMKEPYETEAPSARERKRGETASQRDCGEVPASWAARWILSPCSSVPVDSRGGVGSLGRGEDEAGDQPPCRTVAHRVKTSARTSEWRWPMCGEALT